MEHSLTSPEISTAIGFIVGIVFIVITKKVLDQFEHLKLGEVSGFDKGLADNDSLERLIISNSDARL